ncbi:MAG: MMPL family transporter [Verrucomicrobiota bacterium]
MIPKSRRWLWLLVLIPIALGFTRLRFDVEILNLLPEDSGIVQGLKIYQQNFSNARELIITLHSDDAEKTETAARLLAVALRQQRNLVADATWQPGWLEYPEQSPELVGFIWLNQPPDVFGQLTNKLASNNLSATLAATKDQLATSLSPNEIAMGSYDPLGLMRLPDSVSSAMPMGSGQDLFASADGKFRLVFAEATTDLASYRDCLAWLNQIKAIIAAQESAATFPKGIQIHYTGRPAFVAEIAGGMEHDMLGSVGGTMLIIACLFWIAHRRFLPLIWILVLLAFILGGTMALGGLIFGTLNVVSMGFAAILLGLAVDYGLVLYQEAQAAPHFSAKQIRRELTPSILWSAITTAGAFAILNFGGLPGLAQLGSLVAIGVALAGVVMLFAYLPVVLRGQKLHHQQADHVSHSAEIMRKFSAIGWSITLLILVMASFVLSKEPPRFDHSPDALRPKKSPAYAAVEEIKSALGRSQEPIWILIPGRDEAEVAQRLQRVETELKQAVSNETIATFTLPTPLWPQPQNQSSNRAAVKKLLAEKDHLRAAVLSNGFTSNSFALTENLFETWQSASSQTNTFWPTNQASRWILDKVTSRDSNRFLAIGLVYADTNATSVVDLAKTKMLVANLTARLAPEKVLVSGWTVLGASMFDLVRKDFPRVLVPMIALLIFSLWLAFRRFIEVLLTLASLIFSGICLFLLMSIAHWSWNLLNLMALPLLLGAGVDYSIHLQLALRRHGGNIRETRRSIGRALWLCGGTTIAGFGSLAWSNNAGLSSLGKVCAAGIAVTMLTSIYLLPIWWRATAGRKVEHRAKMESAS